MATKHPENRYHLKEVHQEIAYLDRKISYAETLEKFDSDADRAAALKKLHLKRDPLVKAALELAEKGVEWDAKDLPPSFQKSNARSPLPDSSTSEAASDAQ